MWTKLGSLRNVIRWCVGILEGEELCVYWRVLWFWKCFYFIYVNLKNIVYAEFIYMCVVFATHRVCVCVGVQCSSCSIKFLLRAWSAWCVRWRSWLRHCATSRKVTGLIPDSVTVICLWHNPSGRIISLWGRLILEHKRVPGIFPGGVKTAGA